MHHIEAGLGCSLEKFFADSPVPGRTRLQLSGLRGETLSFQLAYRSTERHGIGVQLAGPLAGQVVVRRIDLAAVEHGTYATPVGERVGRTPGYYPDPLVAEPVYRAYPGQTQGIWFTLPIPEDAPAGRSRLTVRLARDDKPVASLAVDVTVVGATLPGQALDVTHWFHNDCLQSYYGFEAWSREHWRLLDPYLRNAAAHGINVITTPIFTPPLDTAFGTERPTMQLVDVTVTGPNRYRFGFRKLERWIDLCRTCGMTGFELSHLATQWGAKFAPKIVATTGNGPRRIFGWETPSDSPAYRAFLLQFLPALVSCLRRKQALRRSFLHVSDEPHGQEHLSAYRAVRQILREGAPELPVLEALSNIEYYEEGLVDRPCPATDHSQAFLDRGVPHLWCYYCCAQTAGVANRFMDFPAARNRILGWQVFKYGFEGFLHWGYNHWYSGLSDRLLDPYTHVNGGRLLPPGDAFVVYPGPDGPVDSMRWEVFREALQDLRALNLLRDLAGSRPSRGVETLLSLPAIRSMAKAPASMKWILDHREAVNREIVKRVG